MKTLFPAILILLLLGQAFYLPVTVLWLEGQREAIARERCINRNEPELMCQGSCFINRAVAEAIGDAPSDKIPPAASQKEMGALGAYLPGSLLIRPAPFDIYNPRPYTQHSACTSSFIHNIFRPPRLMWS